MSSVFHCFLEGSGDSNLQQNTKCLTNSENSRQPLLGDIILLSIFAWKFHSYTQTPPLIVLGKYRKKNSNKMIYLICFFIFFITISHKKVQNDITKPRTQRAKPKMKNVFQSLKAKVFLFLTKGKVSYLENSDFFFPLPKRNITLNQSMLCLKLV